MDDQKEKIHLNSHLKTSSILPPVPDNYPRWFDEMFVRLMIIFEGQWTYTMRNPKLLELKKAEWYDTLKEFNQSIIAEAIDDVRKNPDDFFILPKFYQVAKTKARIKKENDEMARRRNNAPALEILKANYSDVAKRAVDEIRELLRKKSIN